MPPFRRPFLVSNHCPFRNHTEMFFQRTSYALLGSGRSSEDDSIVEKSSQDLDSVAEQENDGQENLTFRERWTPSPLLASLLILIVLAATGCILVGVHEPSQAECTRQLSTYCTLKSFRPVNFPRAKFSLTTAAHSAGPGGDRIHRRRLRCRFQFEQYLPGPADTRARGGLGCIDIPYVVALEKGKGSQCPKLTPARPQNTASRSPLTSCTC